MLTMAVASRRAFALGALVLLITVSAPHPILAHTDPMPSDANVVFLHHSTGGVIWGGGVPGWIDDYNSTHGTLYTIDEVAFPDSPYPWDNYPYDYWNLWVAHAGGTPYLGQPTLEMLSPQYDVIVFKHCFPVSAIGPDTGNPDVASAGKTLENYRLQYEALRAKLRTFPANRFVVWTGAALRAEDTSPEQAARAREFATWVRTVWDERGDNIFVWDFFSLETDGGLYLTPEHASGDSHPSGTFAAEVAPMFAQRVVDVIRGVADSSGSVSVPPRASGCSLAVVGANPGAGPVRLRIGLATPARVWLSIHDLGGRRVATLADGITVSGAGEWTWEGASGGAAAGVYFARLTTPDGMRVQRLLRID